MLINSSRLHRPLSNPPRSALIAQRRSQFGSERSHGANTPGTQTKLLPNCVDPKDATNLHPEGLVKHTDSGLDHTQRPRNDYPLTTIPPTDSQAKVRNQNESEYKIQTHQSAIEAIQESENVKITQVVLRNDCKRRKLSSAGS